MNIFKEIANDIRKKNVNAIIIIINIAVFTIISSAQIIFYLFKIETVDILSYFAIPSDISILRIRLWTIITYMFSHDNFLILLFNLLIFYPFSKIFLYYLPKSRLVSVYILGGIVGALFFVASYNIFPRFGLLTANATAIGASASVIAVCMAISILAKDIKLKVAFWDVKIIYVALGILVLDLFLIPRGNAGGHIAHLGGACFGVIFSLFYKKNIDITKSFVHFFNSIIVAFKNDNETVKKRENKKIKKEKEQEQEKIDKILEKIKKKGYSSLTDNEKNTLFKKEK